MRSFVIIIIIIITVVASYYFSQLRSWDYVVRGILIFHFVSHCMSWHTVGKPKILRPLAKPKNRFGEIFSFFSFTTLLSCWTCSFKHFICMRRERSSKVRAYPEWSAWGRSSPGEQSPDSPHSGCSPGDHQRLGSVHHRRYQMSSLTLSIQLKKRRTSLSRSARRWYWSSSLILL